MLLRSTHLAATLPAFARLRLIAQQHIDSNWYNQARWMSAMTNDAFYQPCLGASGVYNILVNGEWKASSSGKSVPVINPCTRDVEYRVQGE